MPRPLSWRQLVPGLALCGAGLALLFAIFRYARVGALHGDTLRLHALTDHAGGIAQGSEVWLGGQKVGLVSAVGLAPPRADSSLRVVVTADVLEEYREQIRRDSYAEIRAGGSLIGARVLMISVGTPRAAVLADGDTIATSSEPDREDVTSRVAVASRDFPAIISNVKLLAAQLRATESTVGAMLASDEGGQQMAALAERTSRLATKITRGPGTMGRVLNGEAATRARHVAAEVDTLRALLASGAAALGGFRRDSTLRSAVEDLRDEVSIVRALLDEPRGTAGRALHDAALERELAAAEAELAALIADMKARPLRYVTF